MITQDGTPQKVGETTPLKLYFAPCAYFLRISLSILLMLRAVATDTVRARARRARREQGAEHRVIRQPTAESLSTHPRTYNHPHLDRNSSSVIELVATPAPDPSKAGLDASAPIVQYLPPLRHLASRAWRETKAGAPHRERQGTNKSVNGRWQAKGACSLPSCQKDVEGLLNASVT